MTCTFTGSCCHRFCFCFHCFGAHSWNYISALSLFTRSHVSGRWLTESCMLTPSGAHSGKWLLTLVTWQKTYSPPPPPHLPVWLVSQWSLIEEHASHIKHDKAAKWSECVTKSDIMEGTSFSHFFHHSGSTVWFCNEVVIYKKVIDTELFVHKIKVKHSLSRVFALLCKCMIRSLCCFRSLKCGLCTVNTFLIWGTEETGLELGMQDIYQTDHLSAR